jgi:hypothetical protein
MDENPRLLLELNLRQQPRPEHEPTTYDIKTILEEARKRICTPEGERMIEAVRRDGDVGK